MSRTNAFQPTGRMNLSWRAFDAAAATGASSGATLGGWDVAAAIVDLSDPAQRRLGDYELIEELGRGGMGVVYRARQRSLDREVALKLLAGTLWTRADAAARFATEAASAARMRHPNIVAIHEFASAGERCFYSMELVEGTDLAARLRGGVLEERDAARLVRDLARAVHYAHSLNVLHLDLKPQNVLLEPDGRARIADFGLARPLDRAMSADTGIVAGTPSYMAPEQALLRAAEITRATDVYGLGAILYECLTGHAPFQGESAEDILRAVTEAPIVPPRRLRRGLSRDIEAVCLKCLQRDPAQRYASAEELAEDLGRVLDGNPVQARRLRWTERAWRWLAREPVTPGGLATAALVLLVAGGAWMLQFERNARSEQAARDAFAASAEALTSPAPVRARLEALQRIVAPVYPYSSQRPLEARLEFHDRLRAAVAMRAGEQDPVARELALLLARDRLERDAARWRVALARNEAPLARLLHALWYDDAGGGEAHWRSVVQDIARVADTPGLGDMELAVATDICSWFGELPADVEAASKTACAALYRRARDAAPRNALFQLLQPDFDDAAREAWLAAMQTTPFDDYGPRLYRETLAVLERLAPQLAADDLANGLSARDVAALATTHLIDAVFWQPQPRLFEPCRRLEKQNDAAVRDLCRRSLAVPDAGWTNPFRELSRRSAQWRLDLAERGEPVPKPLPRFYDPPRRAWLIYCCSQRGTHPEWVRLRSTRGERAAEEWLFGEMGESIYR